MLSRSISCQTLPLTDGDALEPPIIQHADRIQGDLQSAGVASWADAHEAEHADAIIGVADDFPVMFTLPLADLDLSMGFTLYSLMFRSAKMLKSCSMLPLRCMTILALLLLPMLLLGRRSDAAGTGRMFA